MTSMVSGIESTVSVDSPPRIKCHRTVLLHLKGSRSVVVVYPATIVEEAVHQC
jgi:hypothetical protein